MANNSTDWGTVAIAAAIVYGIYKISDWGLFKSTGVTSGGSGNAPGGGLTQTIIDNPPALFDFIIKMPNYSTNNELSESQKAKIRAGINSGFVQGDYSKYDAKTQAGLESINPWQMNAQNPVNFGNYLGSKTIIGITGSTRVLSDGSPISVSKPQDIAITHSKNTTNGTTSKTVGVNLPSYVKPTIVKTSGGGSKRVGGTTTYSSGITIKRVA